MAVDGETLVVAAYREDGDGSSTAAAPNDNASNAGAAYVFARSGTIWIQEAYLKAANAGADDTFGVSVGLSGETVVVGAYREQGDSSSTAASPNDNASDAGAAYIFTLPAPEIVVEQPVGTDSTASIDFGSETIGMAGLAKTFTIRNDGASDLTSLLVTVDGTDAGDFSIDASGMAATLAPGASTTFDVTFTPGALCVGTADLHIASNDADENPFDIELRGTGDGSAPTDIFLTPDAVVESVPAGTLVGLLTASDADVGDSFTYSFMSGSGDADNGRFTISGDQLLTAVVFDHEVQATASVRLKVVDSFGLEVEKELLVTITDDRGDDFDMDDLTEAEEEDIYGTSDLLDDSDEDGFEDGFEVVHGFDPDSDLDGTGDRDGDEWVDWLEARLGTDADVPGAGLDLAIYPNAAGDPVVRVGPGGALLGFSVERSTTLDGAWLEVADFPAGLPLGQTFEWIDTAAPAQRAFYKVGFYPLPVPVTAADGFTWATVGDAANAADPATGHGAVAAAFQMSAHEVTIGQWVEFLNAKEASQPADPAKQLYHPWMATDQNVGGIARNGVDGSFTYQEIGSPERPVSYVSWSDAARYVNWLHTMAKAAATPRAESTTWASRRSSSRGPRGRRISCRPATSGTRRHITIRARGGRSTGCIRRRAMRCRRTTSPPDRTSRTSVRGATTH